MSRKKIQNVVNVVAIALATILAWLSGYVVMQIVYNSIAASIVFGTIWAVIVFCECRFSYISLRIDGKVEITKDEIKNNIWHIVAAILLALLVTVPLEIMLFADSSAQGASDLAARLQDLAHAFPGQWIPMVALALLVVAVYLVPIYVKMTSENQQ